ncbi:catalase, partial [Mycobacterium sp. E136]|uniref:catalase n=1 Tax=Mycobacterium sp. E136 TaxID=1834125 RepID=UPI000A510120
FAETEQVAFHPGHLVPGIDITDDPLLQARLFSYLDTQITRLAGPNFGQIPINRPHAPVNDMFRDGFHQHGVHPGVAPYKPNSLDGGCPFLAGADTGAFIEVPTVVPESMKRRAAPATYDDHFSQVTLFYRSLSRAEQEHIAEAYTFELGKCYEQAVKERQLAALANIDAELCATVAAGLGLEAPAPTVPPSDPDVLSPAVAQVGEEWPVEGRQIGILTGPDTDASGVAAAVAAIANAKNVPFVVAAHGGTLEHDGGTVPVSRTYATARSVEFDAILIAGSPADVKAKTIVDEAFRHHKAIAVLPQGTELAAAAAVPTEGPGVFSGSDSATLAQSLIDGLGEHRVWDRVVLA